MPSCHAQAPAQAMPDFRGTKCTASSTVCRTPCGVLSITTSAWAPLASWSGATRRPPTASWSIQACGIASPPAAAMMAAYGAPLANPPCRRQTAGAHWPGARCAGSRAPCRAGRAGARCCRPRWPGGSAPRPGSRSRCRSPARGPAGRWRRSPAQQLDHARHHTGLGDGLAQADRQAGVFIGLVDQRGVDKAVALHRAHGRQHLRIEHALRRPACAPCARAPPRVQPEAAEARGETVFSGHLAMSRLWHGRRQLRFGADGWPLPALSCTGNAGRRTG